jgi:hypothetical protein
MADENVKDTVDAGADVGANAGNAGEGKDVGKDAGADAGKADDASKSSDNEKETGDKKFDLDEIGEDLMEALKDEAVFKDGLYAGKYKSLGEWAKATQELNGKLREKGAQAPDEYDFSEIKIDGHDDVKFDPEDPFAKAMLPVMKKHNISQEAAAELAAEFMKTQVGQVVNSEEELKKLGGDWKDQLTKVNDFAKEKLADADDDVKNELNLLTTTAAGVKLANALMGSGASVIPDDGDDYSHKSAQEWKDEAFDYREKHKATFDSSPDQQKIYDELLTKGIKAELVEKSRK